MICTTEMGGFPMGDDRELTVWIPFNELGRILWTKLEESKESINKEWGFSETKSRFPWECQQGASVKSLESVAVMTISRKKLNPDKEIKTKPLSNQVCITFMQDGVEKTVCYPKLPRC
jgi:hypothetical protein